MYTIFVRKSRYTTKQKGKKRMRRNWKKALCGILTGFMLATAAPAAVPELISATEVQAAINVATPAMSSIKISGRNKIIFSWKQVKGVGIPQDRKQRMESSKNPHRKQKCYVYRYKSKYRSKLYLHSESLPEIRKKYDLE